MGRAGVTARPMLSSGRSEWGVGVLLFVGLACSGVLLLFVMRASPRLAFVVWCATLVFIPVWIGVSLGPFWSAITLMTGAAVVAFALKTGPRRQRALLMGIGLAIVLIPAIAQAVLIGQWGWVWQGRYHLALFGILMVVAGAVIDTSPTLTWRRWHSTSLRVGIWVIVASQVAAFTIALYRYSVGTAQPLWTMFTTPAWQPPLGTAALILIFAVTVAVVGVAIDRRIPRAEVMVAAS